MVLIIFAQWVSVAHIMQLSVHYLKNYKFQTGFYFLMIVVVSFNECYLDANPTEDYKNKPFGLFTLETTILHLLVMISENKRTFV